MQRLHIIGRKNHGKTTLVVELVEELVGRGLRVGAIKHTHHRHELDVPGKDSHRHREAGALVVGVLSKGLSAIFLPTESCSEKESDRYQALSPAFAGCDLVLVEGDSMTASPKIEVWRSAVGDRPLSADDPSIRAIVTDDAHGTATMTLPRSDLGQIAGWVVEHHRSQSQQAE